MSTDETGWPVVVGKAAMDVWQELPILTEPNMRQQRRGRLQRALGAITSGARRMCSPALDVAAVVLMGGPNDLSMPG